ncbi:alpha-hydroxy acid oxidase [Streptomyces werraensis]|uniref:alpha-hydroxy acid oxidase n=1 Tax=Streptomyces werraensis TaxID=68284 RepID=UPI001CE300B0
MGTSHRQPRRLPRPRELAPLLQFDRPELNASRRRTRRAATIEDLRLAARRRAPRAPFDYTDGAAGDESSLRRARRRFSEVELQPAVLRDVAAVNTERTVLGRASALPFGIAPTGFTRMMHTAGEIAGAGAAAAAGIPFALSTMGTTSIEDLTAAVPQGRKLFQLYLWKDRERSKDLIERAAAGGYEALLVTVDVPTAGGRHRDTRNGLTIPPRLTLRTALDAATRPAWWFDLLTTQPLAFATLDSWPGTVADLLDVMFDPTVSWSDLDWLREVWPGRLLVKGIQTAHDAQRLLSHDVDGLILSSHGGRQLERAPVPLDLLPSVRDAVQDRLEVHIDTGIMNGVDIITALAHGADFAWIGRAYLYGLMAGGRYGVDRAIDILATEIRRTMRLLGVTSLDQLQPEHALLPGGARDSRN